MVRRPHCALADSAALSVFFRVNIYTNGLLKELGAHADDRISTRNLYQGVPLMIIS